MYGVAKNRHNSSCATVSFAELASANVVGYNNTAARADLNWYAPQFLTVGANTIDINAITLDDGGLGFVGWGDTMKIVGPLGSASQMYFFYSDPSMDLSGKATGPFWSNTDGNSVQVSFASGDGIAIDNVNAYEYAIQNAGQVPSGNVTVAARADLNWLGNPFPAPIHINAVTLKDELGMVGWGDTMQIVGPLGSASQMYFFYSDPSMDLSGKATGPFWSDTDGNSVDVTLQPGAGFAIDNPNAYEYNIQIACPY